MLPHFETVMLVTHLLNAKATSYQSLALMQCWTYRGPLEQAPGLITISISLYTPITRLIIFHVSWVVEYDGTRLQLAWRNAGGASRRSNLDVEEASWPLQRAQCTSREHGVEQPNKINKLFKHEVELPDERGETFCVTL